MKEHEFSLVLIKRWGLSPCLVSFLVGEKSRERVRKEKDGRRQNKFEKKLKQGADVSLQMVDAGAGCLGLLLFIALPVILLLL